VRTLVDRHQPLRALRVPEAGVVVEELGVCDIEHGHLPRTLTGPALDA
jgi:hypothetical protein